MTKQASRYNKGKPPMHLLPMDALMDIAKIYEFGAKKYAAHNWAKGMSWDEGVKASLLRHLSAWSSGEDIDEDSNLPHDLSIAWNAITLVAYRLRGIGVDDRFKVKKAKKVKRGK